MNQKYNFICVIGCYTLVSRFTDVVGTCLDPLTNDWSGRFKQEYPAISHASVSELRIALGPLYRGLLREVVGTPSILVAREVVGS